MRKILLALNLIIGIGACFGAYFAFSIKEGEELMGVSTAILQNSPFQTFLIPGLYLAVVIAGGNLLCAYLLFRNKAHPYYCEFMTGTALALWIIVQMYMLLAVEALHLIFFALGATQMLLAVLVIRKEKLPLPFQAKQN